MTDKVDSLGRKIPVFDRKAAAKKAAATRKERHGSDELRNAGSRGGKHRTRGYFGHLKDTGRSSIISEIAQKGAKSGQAKGTAGFAANPELARIAGAKGGRISRRGKAKKEDNTLPGAGK